MAAIPKGINQDSYRAGKGGGQGPGFDGTLEVHEKPYEPTPRSNRISSVLVAGEQQSGYQAVSSLANLSNYPVEKRTDDP